MVIRDITASDKKEFNRAAGHPLQAYEWGEFRQKTGVTVIRKAIYNNSKLVNPIQVTVHPVPKSRYNVGYFPKGQMPDEAQMEVLKQIGRENNCIFIKLEPNVGSVIKDGHPEVHARDQIDGFLRERGCRKGRSLFTKHTFQLDISKSEGEILAKMHHKTRYNIRLAERKGVKVVVDNSENSFKWFLKLLFEETIERQGFYAHSRKYFEQLWQVLNPAGIAHLIHAEHEGQVLAVFMVFVFNGKIYYPYGASTRTKRELMAPNLLMWELIKFGKQNNCTLLDMWGSLGPKPNKKDPWFGFHRFKEGYGGDLVEFLGSYDLVINNSMYPIYRALDGLRWAGLKAKAKIRQAPYIMTAGVKKLKSDLLGLFE